MYFAFEMVNFVKKITVLHSKVNVKAPKSIYFVKKTQLKSTKRVFVSTKNVKLWVKLTVFDNGSL